MIEQYNVMCDKILQSNDDSRRDAVMAYKTVLDDLSSLLKQDGVTPELQEKITDKMILVADKIADLHEGNRNFLEGIPGGQVDEQVGDAGHQRARPGTQLFHQLGVAAGAADAVQTAQPRQNGLHLRRGEEGAVHPVALQNGDAAARPLRGGDGDARPAEGLNVPLDGAAGHLEPRRQFRRGDLFPLEQDGQDADEPVQFHAPHRLSCVLPVLYHRNRTAVCHV